MKTNKEIQAAYKARQRKAGLVYVSEWIPQATKQQHKEYCKSMRDNAKNQESTGMTSCQETA